MFYAIVCSLGIVSNTIVYDGSAGAYRPPSGCTLVSNPSSTAVIGGTYDPVEHTFTAPEK